MASSKPWITPMAIRSTHVVLHIITIILICIGITKLPNPPKKGKLLEAARARGSIWFFVEIGLFIMSCAMLISSVVSLKLENPSGAVLKIQTWSSDYCPNFSFFYYLLASLFVLYGAMLGCHIPMLFNKVPIYPFPLSKMPNKLWQFLLIGAVVTAIVNSIVYFVAAFYPTASSTASEPEKVEEVGRNGDKTPINDDKGKDGVSESQGSKTETTGGENEVKSSTG